MVPERDREKRAEKQWCSNRNRKAAEPNGGDMAPSAYGDIVVVQRGGQIDALEAAARS